MPQNPETDLCLTDFENGNTSTPSHSSGASVLKLMKMFVLIKYLESVHRENLNEKESAEKQTREWSIVDFFPFNEQ